MKTNVTRKTIGDGVKFERIRRITGYLVGTTDKWNNAKKAEEHDRVKIRSHREIYISTFFHFLLKQISIRKAIIGSFLYGQNGLFRL